MNSKKMQKVSHFKLSGVSQNLYSVTGPSTCRAYAATAWTMQGTPRAKTRTRRPSRPSRRFPQPLTILGTVQQTERGFRGGCGASGTRHGSLRCRQNQSFFQIYMDLCFHKATINIFCNRMAEFPLQIIKILFILFS